MSVTVCLFFVILCVCMVMNSSSKDKASGAKFCTVVRRHPGQDLTFWGT